MKLRFRVLVTLGLTLLLITACASQDTGNEEGNNTSVPTTAMEAVATPNTSSTEGSPTQQAGMTAAASTPSTNNSATTTETPQTAIIPETGGNEGVEAGRPDDLDEVIMTLRETGVTVELGDPITMDALPIPGQTIRINGDIVNVFSFTSLEEAALYANKVEDLNPPMDEALFYQLGTMIVHYPGRDILVRDLLEDVLGARAAGQ